MPGFRDLFNRIKQEDPEYLCSTGNALTRNGQFREALEQFAKALVLEPEYTEGLFGMGLCYLKLEQPQEAIFWFDQVLAKEPLSVLSHFYKGAALFALNRYEEAIASFDVVTELNPQIAEAWVAKARCFNMLGDHDRADQCMDDAARAQGKYMSRLLGGGQR